MTPDWLLPARCIPVFVTAAVRFRYSGDVAWWDGVVVSEAVDAWGVIKADRNQRFYQRKDYDETIVDLSNPDTFAAARDRLAALVARDTGDPHTGGTTFTREVVKGVTWWALTARGSDDEAAWSVAWTITADFRELALALAWQKVVGA